MNHKKMLFWIVRNHIRIGTVIGIINNEYPEIIIFDENAPILPGDLFEPIKELGPAQLK